MSQNPLDKLNKLENQLNNVGNQVRNPLGRMENQAANIQRTINRGTAGLVSALCYVTGIVSIIPLFKKDWKEDPLVRYHSAHARVMWLAMIIMSCTVIGLPVAGVLWLAGFYLASEAVSGRTTNVPFLTRILRTRGMV